MSGIFGLVDTTSKTDAEAYLRVVQSKISHFPWHIADTWISADQRVGLGRSGIGIFNPEKQPVTSASGDLTLMMAGEFYRTDNLRQKLIAEGFAPRNNSHPELALSAFQAYGKDFARAFEGVFFIVVYDSTHQRIVMTNDRFGLYPHYYNTQPGKLAFAPEVKGVLCAPFVQRKLNVTALAEYMRFQQLLGQKTFHEGIQLFPYGSVGEFDLRTGEWEAHHYWEWDQVRDDLDISLEEAALEVGRLTRESITHLTLDHLRPGVFLSGGQDSRLILGLIPPRAKAVISATFGIKGSRDVYYAEQIAKTMGSEHYWFDFPNGQWVLDYLDLHLKITEGFHDWVHLHGISALGKLRQVMDYNLTGWDGGTIMGHPVLVSPPFTNPIDEKTLVAELYTGFNQRFTWPGLNEAEARLIYTPEYSKQALGLDFCSFNTEFEKFRGFKSTWKAEFFFLVNHNLRMTQNMIKILRSHMEVRFPFWDYRLIDFMYSLKPEIRSNLNLYRAVITHEIPRLSRIPYDHDEFLPTSNQLLRKSHALMVRARRRLGLFPKRPTLYADYENYLRHELRGWAERILFDRRTQERGIFNMSAVQSLFKRHIAGYEEWTIGKIAPLITFEMMMREYFD